MTKISMGDRLAILPIMAMVPECTISCFRIREVCEGVVVVGAVGGEEAIVSEC